ncbi:MAG: 30S ribosomal protein S2 [Candidatus Shapirobacteria bacterium]|nr:30S ribosomal protein S2 [Candidatus Shapirobacteria bacterium]
MTEIKKVVNRTGKKLVTKALVVGAKTLRQAQGEVKVKEVEKVKEEADFALKKSSVESKEDKKYILTIGLKDLLDAGCHLGHKVSKTHPKARKNIYMAKDGIQIVDLTRTMEALEKACNYIYNAQRNGKKIVLVGTKRQAREVIKRVATDAGVAYVTSRWLGGTITNWEQIRKDIKKYWDLKNGLEQGKFTENTKKELLVMKKETIRLEKIVGGIASLEKLFEVVFVVDAGFEKTAVKEAGMRNVKTVAMTDTDTDPRKVDFSIPANDDSVKSINIIVEEVGRAIKSAGVK